MIAWIATLALVVVVVGTAIIAIDSATDTPTPRKRVKVSKQKQQGPSQADDPWGTATAEATVDEVLRLMKPTAHCTPEVIALLATELPGVCKSVTEVAAMTPLRLAARLIGMPSVDEDDLFDIARELIASFRRLVSSPPEPKPAPKAKPAPEPHASTGVSPAEAKWRELLLGHAQARKVVTAGSIHLGPVVIESFITSAGSVHLDRTIVLGRSGTSAGSLRGTAYVPRGVTISTSAGSDNLALYVKTYEELAKLAGLA